MMFHFLRILSHLSLLSSSALAQHQFGEASCNIPSQDKHHTASRL
jgi:hypothetical protein